MPKEIQIKVGDVVLDAELNDSQTADLVWDALPIESGYNTWGDEIYFAIPVSTGPENGVETVELGDLAYWPPGKAPAVATRFGRQAPLTRWARSMGM